MKVIMLLFASPLWCDANVNRWMFNQYLPVSLQSFVNYLNLHGVRRWICQVKELEYEGHA